MIKKVWKDPVWSGVIAKGIIFILGAIVTYVAGLFPVVVSLISAGWEYLWEKSEVENWLLLLMAISCLLVAIVLAIVLILSVKEYFSKENESNDDTNRELSWRDYRRGLINGLDYEWNYDLIDEIISLASFCPECQYQIIPDNVGHFGPRLEFVCKNCGYRAPEFQVNLSDHEQNIRLKIQQNLRTGKWKELINKNA